MKRYFKTITDCISKKSSQIATHIDAQNLIIILSVMAAISILVLSGGSLSIAGSLAQPKSGGSAQERFASQAFTIQVGQTQKKLTADELGISLINPSAMSVPVTTSAVRPIESYASIDQQKLQAVLNGVEPSSLTPMRQPRPIFSQEQQKFIVEPAVIGREPNSKMVLQGIESQIQSRKWRVIHVPLAKRFATISDERAAQTVKAANDFLDQPFSVRLPSQSIVQPSRSEKAAWLTFSENKTIDNYIVSADGQLAGQFIQQQAASLAPAGRASRVTIDGREIQPGQPSLQVADVDGHTSRAVLAAQQLKAFEASFVMTEQAPQTVEMQALPKWIEINLSEQTLTAYEKDKPVFGPVYIASGMSGHETVTGLFNIWLKNYAQTMRGGSKAAGTDYEIPNVQWVSYFFEEYAIHGAWWRDYFGVPGSHGCVNMTNADARWIFNWNEIGTPVLVHY